LSATLRGSSRGSSRVSGSSGLSVLFGNLTLQFRSKCAVRKSDPAVPVEVCCSEI
jgi:hypothetical protein